MPLLAIDDEVLAAAIGEEMRQRLVVIEVALLIERGDLQIGAEPQRALVRRKLGRQQLQQRRLARTVRPDQPKPVAALNARGKVLDDREVAKALGDVLGFDHQFTGLGSVAGGNSGHALGAAMAAETPAHRLQLAEPAHVALAPCRHPVAQPVLFAHDLPAELVLLLLFFLEHRVAPGFEMRKALVEPAGLAASSQTVARETRSGSGGHGDHDRADVER